MSSHSLSKTWSLSMVKSNFVYIRHILDSIDHVESFLKELNNDETEFASKLYWQNAFVRELEIIGEAANHLDKQFIEDHPEIPWSKVIKMRHKLIHDYFDIRMDLVWLTAIQDLPVLKPQLLSLLKDTDQ